MKISPMANLVDHKIIHNDSAQFDNTNKTNDSYDLSSKDLSLLKTSGFGSCRSKVCSYFDLNYEKQRIDLDLGSIDVIPEDQRKGNPIYKTRLKRLVKRYQNLVRNVYTYWTNEHQRKSHEYSTGHYQKLVREIWEKSLHLVNEYESYNPDDKWLRRDTVNDLYFDVSFSDLLFGFGGHFYSQLASDIRDELA